MGMKGVFCFFFIYIFGFVFTLVSCCYFLHFTVCPLTVRYLQECEMENRQKVNSVFATKCDDVVWQFSYTCIIYTCYRV